MSKITPITPNFAVAGALRPEDFAEIRARGFKAIISNLPDGESANHLTAAQEAQLAKEAGLEFRHIPTTKFDVLSERVTSGMQSALTQFRGPVLAHCASGMRSAAAWAGVAAKFQPADLVLEALQSAGFNMAAIREELQEQGGEQHRGAIPPALDATGGKQSA